MVSFAHAFLRVPGLLSQELAPDLPGATDGPCGTDRWFLITAESLVGVGLPIRLHGGSVLVRVKRGAVMQVLIKY